MVKAVLAVISLVMVMSVQQAGHAASLPAAPTVPKNLKAVTASSSAITVSWSASTTKAKIKYYTVYRNGAKLTTTPNLSFVDTGLKSLTTYRYNVSATDTNFKSSAKSANVYGTTLAAPPTVLAASNLSASQVTLTWKPSSDASKLTGYYVYRNGVKVRTAAKSAVSITDTGLSSGTTYTYQVAGYYNRTYLTATTNALNVTTPQAVKPVTACTTITTPGTYSLSNDIATTTSTPCLRVHDTADVIFNCNNYNIRSNHTMVVSVVSVTNFTLTNCNITSQGAIPSNSYVIGAEFMYTTNNTIQSNVFSGSMVVISGFNNGLRVNNNAFINASYEQIESSYSYIGNNYMTWDNHAGAGLIVLTRGSFNTVELNTLDGKGGGTNGIDQYGYDNAISLSYQDSATIHNNTITNVFGCSIETIGMTTNTTISDNKISHATNCGIGGWHILGWRNNLVSGNTVDYSNNLFWFFREGELRPEEPYVYFDNNTFTGNTITNLTSDISAWINLNNSAVPAASVIAANNVFAGNNFGTTGMAPYLKPESAIVDGGGNICGAYNTDSPAHLTCVEQ
jgi:chitodextrinase